MISLSYQKATDSSVSELSVEHINAVQCITFRCKKKFDYLRELDIKLIEFESEFE